MPTPKNPFTPAFGSEPLVLAGREQIIENLLAGLENGPGDPNRSSILVGPRGSGKTVLLSKIANEATEIGWIAANVTASSEMLKAILEQVEHNGREFLPQKAKERLSELHAFGIGFGIESIEGSKPSWRLQMTRIFEILAEYKIGVLITVDEVDAKQPELIRLVSDFQHFVRERREVALIMAGLPGNVLQMFQDESISFVRRAFQYRLESIPLSDVKTAIRKTVESSGRAIDDDALVSTALYTNGFPFLIQLAGYHIWRQSPDETTITQADVDSGVESAEEYMDRMVLDTTMSELSDNDIAFLLAMLPDKDISKMNEITQRLGTTANQAGQYRLRLIKQGVIEECGRGKVQFALPFLKDYLLKNYPENA